MNLKYPFCNERILIFFDSLDSGHQRVINVIIHALITFQTRPFRFVQEKRIFLNIRFS